MSSWLLGRSSTFLLLILDNEKLDLYAICFVQVLYGLLLFGVACSTTSVPVSLHYHGSLPRLYAAIPTTLFVSFQTSYKWVVEVLTWFKEQFHLLFLIRSYYIRMQDLPCGIFPFVIQIPSAIRLYLSATWLLLWNVVIQSDVIHEWIFCGVDLPSFMNNFISNVWCASHYVY